MSHALDKAINKMGDGALGYVFGGLVLMVVYIMVALSNCKDKSQSRALVGLCSVLCVAWHLWWPRVWISVQRGFQHHSFPGPATDLTGDWS